MNITSTDPQVDSIQYLVVCHQSWDSSLGCVWAERFSVWSWQQQENVLLSRTSKQTLRPTKLTIQWLLRVLF